MPDVPESVRVELKKPLGKLMGMSEFASKYGKEKIIAVGDVVALALLSKGLQPFASVFDFRTKRAEIAEEEREKLETAYPRPLVCINPPGTISEDLENKVALIVEKGGALLVEGEEDLATLVFMRLCGKAFIIAYGQPDEGIVAVECGKKAKEKAELFFRKIEKA